MIEEVRILRPQIEALCHRHHVRRLELFGSMVNDSAGPGSDVDFLVDFAPLADGQYAKHFFSLKDDLEELLRRPVDLVVLRAIKNPYFLQGIQPSRELLYAA